MGDISGMMPPVRPAHLLLGVGELERREVRARRRRDRAATRATRPRELEELAEATGHPTPSSAASCPTTPSPTPSGCSTSRWRRPGSAASGRWAAAIGAPRADVLRALAERDLVFELMAHPDLLESSAAALADSGDLTVVVEHAGWPRSDDARGVRAVEARDLGAGVAGRQRALQAVGPGHAAPLDGGRRVWHRGSSTASSRSASTGACSRATSRSTPCTARSTSSTRASTASPRTSTPTTRDKLFAANAERLYRC